MNKYFFRIKMRGCETNTWEQRVMWADTQVDAENELHRLYGANCEIVIFIPA